MEFYKVGQDPYMTVGKKEGSKNLIMCLRSHSQQVGGGEMEPISVFPQI